MRLEIELIQNRLNDAKTGRLGNSLPVHLFNPRYPEAESFGKRPSSKRHVDLARPRTPAPMAFEYGVVLASLMGAAAALMGGVIAQRYQYMLERQAEHFAILRDNTLVPWKRAIEARKSNLEGRDPYVVIDYVAKDYRS